MKLIALADVILAPKPGKVSYVIRLPVGGGCSDRTSRSVSRSAISMDPCVRAMSAPRCVCGVRLCHRKPNEVNGSQQEAPVFPGLFWSPHGKRVRIKGLGERHGIPSQSV